MNPNTAPHLIESSAGIGSHRSRLTYAVIVVPQSAMRFPAAPDYRTRVFSLLR